MVWRFYFGVLAHGLPRVCDTFFYQIIRSPVVKMPSLRTDALVMELVRMMRRTFSPSIPVDCLLLKTGNRVFQSTLSSLAPLRKWS
jgi:hypothetical protein